MNILVIGRNPEILETVVKLIKNQPDWNAIGALTNDHAKEIFTTQKFHVVLLGGGISSEDEAKLTDYFKANDPTIKVIQHFGGGSGLLLSEIYGALKS